MAFADTFRSVCAEVTDLVYQLDGLEIAYGFFESSALVHAESVENPEYDLESQVSDSDVLVPTDYPFNPAWALNYTFVSGGETKTYLAADQIDLAFQQAWRPSTSDLVSRAELIIHPNIAAMAAACESLAATSTDLYNFTRDIDANSGSSLPGFVQRLKKSWAGLASTGFYDFYEDLTDLVYRYFDATTRQATASACSTNAIDQFQRNILEAAEKTRDFAKAALQAWQKHDRPITIEDVDTVDSQVIEVLDGFSLGAGLVAAVPSPLSVPVGGVSLVADILSFVSEEVLNKKVVTLPTGGQIHDNLASALSEAQEQMLNALDVIRTGNAVPGGSDDPASIPVIPFDQYVKDSENNAGWRPPSVDFS